MKTECCGKPLPEGAKFCPQCGKATVRKRQTRRRGNGTGSVYKLPNGKWRGAVEVGKYIGEDGKLHRKVNSRNFNSSKEAVAWVATPEARQERRKDLTLKDLYDLWKETYTGGKQAVDAYRAAFAKYKPLWVIKLSEIVIDDLQECMDLCERGRQTKENMKTVLNLMYKYGIPRHYVPDNLNLAQFLKPSGKKVEWKEGIPLEYLDKMWDFVGTVPYIEYVICQCYLGFRPGELLALDALNYNRKERAITGGFKTEAGRNRTVTISPKIQPFIDDLTYGKLAGPIFCDKNGKPLSMTKYTAIFEESIAAVGLDNPELEQNGRKYKKYTPHSCRHTFATLMKRVDAAKGNKLALIGHTTEQMLRHYEDIHYADLREITDAI